MWTPGPVFLVSARRLRITSPAQVPSFAMRVIASRASSRSGSSPVGHDGGERLVDLMGNGGRELPHRRQPRNVGEFRLRVSQRFLGPLAFGDVHHRADKFEIA